jgi:hypothetical protein
MTKNIRQLQESLSTQLPKPIASFVISLKQSKSIGQRRTVAGLFTSEKVLAEALDDSLTTRSVEALALASLLPSCRQEGYKKINDKWEPTGQTFTKRAGAEHLLSRHSPIPLITFSKFETDKIVLQSKQFLPGYERLQAFHLKTIKARSALVKKKPPVPQK